MGGNLVSNFRRHNVGTAIVSAMTLGTIIPLDFMQS